MPEEPESEVGEAGTGPALADDEAPRRRGSGWGGCALWALALFVVVLGGCVVGLALRPGNGPKRVAYGNGWTLQAHLDVDKSPCLALMVPQGQLTGQCAFATSVDPNHPGQAPQYVATSGRVGSSIVIFGPVPSGVASVRLHLADGSMHIVAVKTKAKVHYFVYVSSVRNAGHTELLGPTGAIVTIPE